MATQTIQDHTTLNGVNVDKQEETIQAVKARPELARFQFRVQNQWQHGAHNQIHIDSYYGTCQEMAREKAFTLTADQPSPLLGTNKGPNPLEYLLAALSSCMATSLVYQAAAQGISIETLESDYEGGHQFRGNLGIESECPEGI